MNEVWMPPAVQSRAIKMPDIGKPIKRRKREDKERVLSEAKKKSIRYQAYRIEGFRLNDYRYPKGATLTIEMVTGEKIVRAVSLCYYWGIDEVRNNMMRNYPIAIASYITVKSKANQNC